MEKFMSNEIEQKLKELQSKSQKIAEGAIKIIPKLKLHKLTTKNYKKLLLLNLKLLILMNLKLN